MKKVILAVVLFGIYFFSAQVYAQIKPGGRTTNKESVCGRLLDETKSELGPEETKQLIWQRVEEKRNQRDEQIIQQRKLLSERRGVSYTKILALAGSEEKKAAFEIFRQEVDTAIVEFQEAQDEILTEFRTEADELASNSRLSQDSELSKISSIEKKVLMNDFKTYCKEGTFSDEEVAQMMKTKGLKVPGQPSIIIGDEFMVIQNEKKQQLTLARNQLQETIRKAAEKLKASF